MVADIVAKYVPELKEKRSITGAMYEAFCPYCNVRNTDWAGCVNKGKEPSMNNVCSHFLSHEVIKFNEAAKFVFTNDEPVFAELEPTTVKIRNYSIEGAKISENDLHDLMNHEEIMGYVGNSETDRVGITKGGETTKRGDVVLKEFRIWYYDLIRSIGSEPEYDENDEFMEDTRC